MEEATGQVTLVSTEETSERNPKRKRGNDKKKEPPLVVLGEPPEKKARYNYGIYNYYNYIYILG